MNSPRGQEEQNLNWKGELTRGLYSPEKANGKVFDMSGPL